MKMGWRVRVGILQGGFLMLYNVEHYLSRKFFWVATILKLAGFFWEDIGLDEVGTAFEPRQFDVEIKHCFTAG